MSGKKLLSGEFANSEINKALRDLERDWRKAGFLSASFKERRKIFKQIIYDEMREDHYICEHGC